MLNRNIRGRQKIRSCLKCDRQFRSKHRFNRLCDYCVRQNAEVNYGVYVYVGGSSKKPWIYQKYSSFSPSEVKDEALFVRKAENLAREGDFIPNAQLFTPFHLLSIPFSFLGGMVSNLQAVSPIFYSPTSNLRIPLNFSYGR